MSDADALGRVLHTVTAVLPCPSCASRDGYAVHERAVRRLCCGALAALPPLPCHGPYSRSRKATTSC
ncbi:hypothetical protein HUW46_04583 [Amycolatopsis sp. CA-230715]|nr:hypothetical protein HUW46_04583 [Amycolatopsis sp. CA-230715]